MPIGPKIKQLNHELAYQDGKENQLTHWQKVGYLKAKAEDIANVVPLVSMNDAKASLGERARSYWMSTVGIATMPMAPLLRQGFT